MIENLTETQQTLLKIIKRIYFDPIDSIGEPYEDEDWIAIQFRDGKKLLEAKFFPDRESRNIAIRLLNPEDLRSSGQKNIERKMHSGQEPLEF